MSERPHLTQDSDDRGDVDQPDGAPLEPDVREATLQVAKRALAWSGPLPPPDVLAAYDDVRPGLVDDIVATFRLRSELQLAALRYETESSQRELAVEEREQALREKEADADIKARMHVLWFGSFFLPLLVILAFVVAMWGPDGNSARAVIVVAFLAPISLLAGILLLRGRMSANERDIYRDAIPHLGHPTASRRGTASSQRETTSPASEHDVGQAPIDESADRP